MISVAVECSCDFSHELYKYEKSDKSNGTDPYIFMRKYSILMRFAKTEKETKLNDIRKKEDDLFKRDWTPESGEQLNEEVNTLGTLEMTLVRLERILKTTLIIGEKSELPPPIRTAASRYIGFYRTNVERVLCSCFCSDCFNLFCRNSM